MMAENVVLPGDRVSSAEEYEAGSNTFDDMGIIRADTIGTTNMDSATHMVSIKRAKLHPVAQPDVCFTHVGTEVLLISDLSAEADMISSLTRYSILAINSSSLIIPSDHQPDVCFTHCGTDNNSRYKLVHSIDL